MSKRIVAIAALLLTAAGHPVRAADVLCKDVGNDWTWFSDHVVGSITYVIVGSPGRKFEAGTGVFFRGKPWGSVVDGGPVADTNSYAARMTAFGAGALHVRQRDAGPPAKICATSTNVTAITIIQSYF